MERLLVIAAVVLATVLFSVWWNRREGRFAQVSSGEAFHPDDLGLTRRERPSAVLVEFSGEGCAPCRTVRQRLHKLAGELPDLKVVEIDAGEHLDLADRYGVRRVPTVFVADPDLRIVWRASGVPTEDSIKGVLLGPEWAGRPQPRRTLGARFGAKLLRR